MKRFLLLLTLLVSFTGFSQLRSTLRFTKTATFDELIHSFDNLKAESGYFEFDINEDRKITMLHYHDANNKNCYSSVNVTLVKTAFDKESCLIFDTYKAIDENGKETTFNIFMDEKFNMFNIMVSDKLNRAKIFTIDTFQVDYLGESKIRTLEKWYINKSIYDINSILNK